MAESIFSSQVASSEVSYFLSLMKPWFLLEDWFWWTSLYYYFSNFLRKQRIPHHYQVGWCAWQGFDIQFWFSLLNFLFWPLCFVYFRRILDLSRLAQAMVLLALWGFWCFCRFSCLDRYSKTYFYLSAHLAWWKTSWRSLQLSSHSCTNLVSAYNSLSPEARLQVQFYSLLWIDFYFSKPSASSE